MPSLRERVRYGLGVIQARVGAVLLQRAARKQKGPFDRFCARILGWLTNSSGPAPDHFMRDEIIDAGIQFDPEELDQYQQKSSPTEDTK